MKCPLNAVLGRLVEDDSSTLNLVRGNLAHVFLEALGRGVESGPAKKLVVDAFEAILDVPAWKRERELEDFVRLIDRTAEWSVSSTVRLTPVGVEVPVTVEVAPDVTIHGYIDRLVKAGEDYMVVDLKTGKTVPTLSLIHI